MPQNVSSAAGMIGALRVNSFVYKLILFAFLSSADFFQNQHFRKLPSGKSSECQTVWIQIRPDILLGLIWVQTACEVIRVDMNRLP